MSSFEIPLQPRWRSALFLVALLAGCGLVAFEALRIGTAATLGGSVDVLKLRRAVALDPANPALHHRLGLFSFYALDSPLPSEGLRQLQLATQLNGSIATYWVGLASAYDSIGDRSGAGAAFARAVALSPTTPRFHWLAGNYDLRTGQSAEAMSEFARLLSLVAQITARPDSTAESDQYIPAVFELCLRAFNDPEAVFQKVVSPANSLKLKLAYAVHLCAQHRIDPASRVWTETVANGSSFQFSLAEPYLDCLLSLGNYQRAENAWEDLVRLGVVRKPVAQEGENLVFNGSFEQSPLNSGFDWRCIQAPGYSIVFPDSDAYQGTRCLRLDFTLKQNVDYEPVVQIVPVLPYKTYLLKAYARSADITSDSGPCLRVRDPANPSELDASSAVTVGTKPWNPIGLTFTTGADTQAVRLSVWRARSRSFPFEISGTFWLDAVSLKEADASAAGGGR